MTDHPPLEKFYDLSGLSQAGDDVTIIADEATCAAIAAFADVLEVKRFEARVSLKRPSPNRFHLTYDLLAEIVQACVVTLEPVENKIALGFERELKLAHARARRAVVPESFEAAEGQDEGPEDIDSPVYDLAGPVLEEFVLAIDPYPRAPGAAFTPPVEEVPEADNPFAVLKNLKKQGP